LEEEQGDTAKKNLRSVQKRRNRHFITYWCIWTHDVATHGLVRPSLVEVHGSGDSPHSSRAFATTQKTRPSDNYNWRDL